MSRSYGMSLASSGLRDPTCPQFKTVSNPGDLHVLRMETLLYLLSM